jgi:hypothetical protein
MEIASFHSSGSYNFEVTPRFLKNMCIPVLVAGFFVFPSLQQIVFAEESEHF